MERELIEDFVYIGFIMECNIAICNANERRLGTNLLEWSAEKKEFQKSLHLAGTAYSSHTCMNLSNFFFWRGMNPSIESTIERKRDRDLRQRQGSKCLPAKSFNLSNQRYTCTS